MLERVGAEKGRQGGKEKVRQGDGETRRQGDKEKMRQGEDKEKCVINLRNSYKVEVTKGYTGQKKYNVKKKKLPYKDSFFFCFRLH